jgi:hypothetical protein
VFVAVLVGLDGLAVFFVGWEMLLYTKILFSSFRHVGISELPHVCVCRALRLGFCLCFGARLRVVIPIFSTPSMLNYVGFLCMSMWRHAENSILRT